MAWRTGQKLAPQEAWIAYRWQLARATGWALEYIDGLSVIDVQDCLAVQHAENALAKSEAQRRKVQLAVARKGKR